MAGAVTQSPFGNVLDEMELQYGSATEGEAVAKKWFDKHGKSFGHFINGQWYKPVNRECTPSKSPSTGETLAHSLEANEEDVQRAVTSAEDSYKKWADLPAFTRAKFLYSVTRNIQKNQSLLAIVEAVDSGMPAREIRNAILPAVIRTFYHYAGWAQVLPEEMKGWSSIGVTAVFPCSSSPLLQLAQRVAPALACGNTVIVMPSRHTRLSALLFADICAQAGLPSGVFNVVTGSIPSVLAAQPNVDVVTLAGKYDDGCAVRKLVAGSGKKVSLELKRHCPLLVFEEADLDSAVENIVEAAFSNSGQNTYSASRLFVQESIYKVVINKLKCRMSKLTVGDNLDKNKDQGCLADPSASTRLTQLVEEARSDGAEVFQSGPAPPSLQNCFPPTLVTEVQTSSNVFVEEPCGPILVAIPFRTVKEGIALANHGVGGIAAGIWTENISVALEVASLMQVSTVWVNSYGLLDAACYSGGCKASGFGHTGGKKSLYNYMKPSWQEVVRTTKTELNLDKFGTSSSSDLLPRSQAQGGAGELNIDKTYKIFYGGAQKRPDAGASLPVTDQKGQVVAYVPDAGKKDVRNAVEAALKAAPGWGKKDGHGRSQILFYLAENLQCRKSDFATFLTNVGKQTDEERLHAEGMIDLAVERLFYWAAYCDKYGGSVQESSFYGHTYEQNNPLGVIGVVCPDDFPFLAFISLIAPAIARGNAVIAIPSGSNPIPALAFHQILETSDVPAGVVNILSGDRDVLTRTLAQHQDVSAVWYFGSGEAGSTFVEAAASVGMMKRTWVNYGRERNWSEDYQQGHDLLLESTTAKTIWLPMGDIFAN